MSTIEFLKWLVEEHPWMSFFAICGISRAIGSLGGIGSTRIKIKLRNIEADEESD